MGDEASLLAQLQDLGLGGGNENNPTSNEKSPIVTKPDMFKDYFLSEGNSAVPDSEEYRKAEDLRQQRAQSFNTYSYEKKGARWQAINIVDEECVVYMYVGAHTCIFFNCAYTGLKSMLQA